MTATETARHLAGALERDRERLTQDQVEKGKRAAIALRMVDQPGYRRSKATRDFVHKHLIDFVEAMRGHLRPEIV